MEELIHWVSFLCFQSINVNPGTTVEFKKKCIMHGGEEAWLKYSSCEKEAWADFELNVSQQCFKTAKNTNMSLATTKSVMSRIREVPLYRILCILRGAPHF